MSKQNEELHNLANFIVDFEFEDPAHLHINKVMLIEKYEAMIEAYLDHHISKAVIEARIDELSHLYVANGGGHIFIEFPEAQVSIKQRIAELKAKQELHNE